MTEQTPRPRPSSSPYSRTGLFPWGNTYDVPALRRGDQWSSQTPCHLRTVRLPPEATHRRQVVRCAVCGRVWSVQVRPHRTPLTAVWTA